MGRQGPCNNCKTKSSPFWRSRPLGKSILCNACRSRYRLRGTLANYTLKAHVRALAPLQYNNNRNFQDYKVQTAKNPTNWQIRKVHSEERIKDKTAVLPYYLCPSGFQDGTSNGSCSGSSSLVSGSHIQLGSMDWNASGPVKLSFLDFHIHTKKGSRTQDSSFQSVSLEEVLLYESGDPTYSSETVYGYYLLKSQSVSSKEEESEASSPIVENKVACVNKS
ncbi:hypothetical protein GIB67_012176 [Kingdonia uniflora]|uniref:GATA-type domain-containing protein n=1 Tax=Kingdonia uniflora TaxID=39325 RepID=A0A7J7NPC6_9MAGN|nr:hypothetical protein GIB67_012176 [Kingdonia uniflora]